MNKMGNILAGRIIAELKELSRIVERVDKGWEKAVASNDDYYIDGVALNLHGFYSGIELIFEKIATHVDETVPSGANWHRELLNQMNLEIPGLRPAVISTILKEQLEEYRGFRHVVRNIYAYRFNPEKIVGLVKNLKRVLLVFETDMAGFVIFLRSIE